MRFGDLVIPSGWRHTINKNHFSRCPKRFFKEAPSSNKIMHQAKDVVLTIFEERQDNLD